MSGFGAVDAHAHIGRHFPGWRSEDSVADLVGSALEQGVSTVLVSSLGDDALLAYPSPEQLRAANAHTRSSVDRFPDVLAGVVYVSPEHVKTSLEEMRRHIADGPFVGVKLWIAVRASDFRLDPILDYAGQLGVVVVQHAWHKTVGQFRDESTPSDVAVLASRHPGVTIQMAHLGGAGERGVRAIAPYPNVVVDTCGGDPERGIVEYAIEHLGPERVLFGSDAPIRDIGTQLTKVTGAHVDPFVRRAILGDNARRVYARLPRAEVFG